VHRAKQQFYLKATHFANNYKFALKRDKKMYLLHSDGVSFSDIAKLMHTTLHKVRRRIEKLDKIMLNEKE
jgi:Fic family protein